MSLHAKRCGYDLPPLQLRSTYSVENDEDRSVDTPASSLDALFDCLSLRESLDEVMKRLRHVWFRMMPKESDVTETERQQFYASIYSAAMANPNHPAVKEARKPRLDGTPKFPNEHSPEVRLALGICCYVY